VRASRWLSLPSSSPDPAGDVGLGTAVGRVVENLLGWAVLDEHARPSIGWGEVVITVHPDQELTDELVLAIVISAEWLDSYFSSPQSVEGAQGILNWS